MKRDERGGGSALLILGVAAGLIVMAGVVVDGSAQLAAARTAEAAADQACRAGLAASTIDRLSGQTGAARAASAARAQLAAAHVTGTVSFAGGQLSVRTTVTSQTTFLSIVGINTVTGTGTATAALVPTGSQIP